MKDNLKVVISFVGVIILVFAFFLKSHLGDIYKINLVKLDEITSIKIDNLAQGNNLVIFTDLDLIKKIYEIFNDKTTKIESISDNPTNVDKLFIVTFMTEKDTSVISVYEKNNKFYLEQPYNGIYEIEESEYNVIRKCRDDKNYTLIEDAKLKSDKVSTEYLVYYNNVLYGKSHKMVDYKNENESVGKIDILIGEEYVPNYNGETNNKEILNALVFDLSDTSMILKYNNEFILFEKVSK